MEKAEQIATLKRFIVGEEDAQISTIMTLVTGAITLILGVIIFAKVSSTMTTGDLINDSEALACINSTSSVFYSSANLIVIGFIVLAAVFILSIVQRLHE